MTIIYAATNDQVLVATILPKLAQNNINMVRLHVDFDGAWDEVSARSAVFTTSKNPLPYEAVFSAAGDCLIPSEVLAEECKLHITVKGVNSSTGKVKTSTKLTVKVLDGTPAVIISDPTPNVYQQLLFEVAVNAARINSFTKLENGSTTGDAELADIRVGANGTTYATAGEAVRQQFETTMRTSNKQLSSANYMDYFSDANDAPNGRTYFIQNDVTSGMIANLPQYGVYGLLTTVNFSSNNGNGKYQLYVTSEGELYWRFQYGTDDYYIWSHWNRALRSGRDGSTDMFATGKSDSVKLIFDETAHTFTIADSSGTGFLWTAHRYLATQNIKNKTLSLVNAETNTYFIYLRNDELVLEKMFDYKPAKDDVVLSQLYLRLDGSISHNIWTLGDKQEEIHALENRVHTLENDINKNSCAIFSRVCCCGDSYTSGHIDTGNGATITNENFAYPSFMARLTGNEYINCGRSGANVLTWQTDVRGLIKAQATGKVQAYLVGFGLNDTAEGTNRFVQLGTTADIGTDNETYYGGLSKIIRELNAISPDAMIFVQTMPFVNTLRTSYNKAIRDIVSVYAEKYNVHLLDLYEYRDMYENSVLSADSIGGHYTAIGYQQFAEILRVIWSEYINSNIPVFQNVHLIEYSK